MEAPLLENKEDIEVWEFLVDSKLIFFNLVIVRLHDGFVFSIVDSSL